MREAKAYCVKKGECVAKEKEIFFFRIFDFIKQQSPNLFSYNAFVYLTFMNGELNCMFKHT